MKKSYFSILNGNTPCSECSQQHTICIDNLHFANNFGRIYVELESKINNFQLGNFSL